MKSFQSQTFSTQFSGQADSGTSLFLKILLLVLSFVLLVSFAIGMVFWREQEKVLYGEKMKSGQAILTFFSSNATIPLLNDDTLALNSLLKEVANTPGFLYAAIADRDGNIRAHTDPQKIGAVIDGLQTSKVKAGLQGIMHHRFTRNGLEVLQISGPIVFRTANLGSVYLGLSIKSIKQQITQNNIASLRAALPASMFVLVMAIAVSFFISRRIEKNSGFGLSPSGKVNNPLYYMKRLQTGAQGLQSKKVRPLPLDIARHQVTVLFAGVKGFKKYADTRKPEEALEHLNEYFAIATNHIQAFGGYIDKFVGDAVIAVFGSSPLEPDHAERAVRCAMAMQQAFKDAQSYKNQLLGLVGIGVSSGIVLSGTMGSRDKMQYTFIGESFRSAYFLSVMAGPGETIVSKDVHQFIEDLVIVEPVPPREMIDRSEAWDSFRLKEIV